MNQLEIQCPRCNGTGKLFGDDALGVQVGLKVAARRTEQNMTQHDLAARLQIGRTQLANIEMGRGANSLTTIAAIAGALECKLADLLP